MKIAYVAKHGPHDNQDEDAITFALRQLGHAVVPFSEGDGGKVNPAHAGTAGPFDFLLCHKWEDFDRLAAIRFPKVCWYFDLISSDDWDLKARSEVREAWLAQMTKAADLVFLTDGDAVARDLSGKLRWLPQGADERVVGMGVPSASFRPELQSCDLLFCGSTIHGGKRISHLSELRERYGSRLQEVGHHSFDRIHGRRLANLMASCKILVCPDGPVTDRYWSNRLFQGLGFGAFMLHPYCEGIKNYYRSGIDLVLYHSRDQFHQLVERYVVDDESRRRIGMAGLQATLEKNLYRHRCQELVEEVHRRLL